MQLTMLPIKRRGLSTEQPAHRLQKLSPSYLPYLHNKTKNNRRLAPLPLFRWRNLDRPMISGPLSESLLPRGLAIETVASDEWLIRDTARLTYPKDS
jgi:hypothetical protein